MNNQAPTEKTTALPKLPLALQELEAAARPDDVLRSVYLVVDTGTATGVAIKADAVTAAAQSFAGYFDDKDAADKPKLTFTISSAQPQYAVVAAYKKDGSAVYVDVTDSPSTVTKIYLNVSASDGTATAGPVKIPVALPSQIRQQTYKASQSVVTGVVKSVSVQNRPGRTHLISGVFVLERRRWYYGDGECCYPK